MLQLAEIDLLGHYSYIVRNGLVSSSDFANRQSHNEAVLMLPRHRRLAMIGLILAGVSSSAVLAFKAFQENLSYYFSPSQVVAGEARMDRNIRLGGLVLEDSIDRDPGSLTVRFIVTDLAHSVPVEHTGLLPDLFQEGSGVVTRGRLLASGEFMATAILAKHDESYMAPEVAESIETAKRALLE